MYGLAELEPSALMSSFSAETTGGTQEPSAVLRQRGLRRRDSWPLGRRRRDHMWHHANDALRRSNFRAGALSNTPCCKLRQMLTLVTNLANLLILLSNSSCSST